MKSLSTILAIPLTVNLIFRSFWRPVSRWSCAYCQTRRSAPLLDMPRRLLALLFGSLFLVGAISLWGTEDVWAQQPPGGEQTTEKRPNVIVIFTDDQGYADLSAQGILDDVETPNIDRLAKNGVRFTSGYVTAPQCTPSRAGLITGRYQQRFGVGHIGLGPLPLEETTIAERLKAAGYATGMVGKWHLEPNRTHRAWAQRQQPALPINDKGHVQLQFEKHIRPYMADARGFTDVFQGLRNRYWHNYTLDGRSLPQSRYGKVEGYRLNIQSEAAVAFIERHHDEPFFLYFAPFAPHVPLEATEEYLSRFPGPMPNRRRYALAMLSAVDEGVGQILKALSEHDLTKNTMIFFISDNGAPLKIIKEDLPLDVRGAAWDGSLNNPLRGEKGMVMEGGVRVPFVASWPGTFPAGRVEEKPVIALDVGATALAAAGLAVPDRLDGIDLALHLQDGEELPQRPLFFRFWGQAAVRDGRWKLLALPGGRRYLYDMHAPLNELERENTLDQHPAVAQRLERLLERWQEQLEDKQPREELNRQEQKWYDHYLEGQRDLKGQGSH